MKILSNLEQENEIRHFFKKNQLTHSHTTPQAVIVCRFVIKHPKLVQSILGKKIRNYLIRKFRLDLNYAILQLEQHPDIEQYHDFGSHVELLAVTQALLSLYGKTTVHKLVQGQLKAEVQKVCDDYVKDIAYLHGCKEDESC